MLEFKYTFLVFYAISYEYCTRVCVCAYMYSASQTILPLRFTEIFSQTA